VIYERYISFIASSEFDYFDKLLIKYYVNVK